jgi:hypothetical protein
VINLWKIPKELPLTNHNRAQRFFPSLTKKEIENILREVEENGNSEKFEEPISKESKERN